MTSERRRFLSRDVPETASVLGHDRELLERLPPARRAAAERSSFARVLRVPTGSWEARHDAALTGGGHGMLVLRGLLVRRVGLENRLAAELLGPGDLLRPLEHDGELATLPFEASWRVLEPVRVAVLDDRWTVRMAPFPGVGVGLTARAMARSRRLANMFVIAGYPHLEDRLWLVLWELADRYGTVRPDGVHVPIRMTHQVLSELVVARRPSVSTALGRLEDRVQRVRDGWLLHGDPPDLQSTSTAQREPMTR